MQDAAKVLEEPVAEVPNFFCMRSRREKCRWNEICLVVLELGKRSFMYDASRVTDIQIRAVILNGFAAIVIPRAVAIG